MQHRRNIAVAAFVGVFLVLLGLSWVCGRGDPASRRLRFKPVDSSITPLFVVITRGRWETNQIGPASVPPQVGYIHRFYCASQESCQPVSALSYRVRWLVQPGLRRLGFWGKFCGPSSVTPTTTDTSMLWFGYRATNSVYSYSEEAILLSDQGLRLPLAVRGEDSFTARSEHLMTWQLPSRLTNRGKYRLTLSKSNRTLVTFDYE
jgi:hypothetical protein